MEVLGDQLKAVGGGLGMWRNEGKEVTYVVRVRFNSMSVRTDMGCAACSQYILTRANGDGYSPYQSINDGNQRSEGTVPIYDSLR